MVLPNGCTEYISKQKEGKYDTATCHPSFHDAHSLISPLPPFEVMVGHSLTDCQPGGLSTQRAILKGPHLRACLHDEIERRRGKHVHEKSGKKKEREKGRAIGRPVASFFLL